MRQIFQQPQRLLINPLQVIDGNQQRAGFCQRPEPARDDGVGHLFLLRRAFFQRQYMRAANKAIPGQKTQCMGCGFGIRVRPGLLNMFHNALFNHIDGRIILQAALGLQQVLQQAIGTVLFLIIAHRDQLAEMAAGIQRFL